MGKGRHVPIDERLAASRVDDALAATLYRALRHELTAADSLEALREKFVQRTPRMDDNEKATARARRAGSWLGGMAADKWRAVEPRARMYLPACGCVELESSTRLQCERTRQFRRELFSCASKTRGGQSIRPEITRIDFDVTELESSLVWPGPPESG
jgi:hypothetical protein